MFEAIEEEDRVIDKDEGLPPALLGSCNDRAKQLHASPSGSFTNNFIIYESLVPSMKILFFINFVLFDSRIHLMQFIYPHFDIFICRGSAYCSNL